MTAVIALVAHLLMCAYIFWSVFVRATWLDERSLPGIRLVFCILGWVALLGIAWPIARQWSPDLWTLALLSAVCLVQRVTAERWNDGVPKQFMRREFRRESNKREVIPL